MRALCLKKSLYMITMILFLLVLHSYLSFDQTFVVSQSKRITWASKKVYVETTPVNNEIVKKKERTDLKYILQWTSPNDVPFVYMGVGQQGFIDRKCPHTNCIVTSNRSYLGDYTKFDVIAFYGPKLSEINEFPKRRSPNQKFVFASIETSHYYPVCSKKFDGYFNWTWTYRLDSEVRWGSIVIRNKNNSIIGPRKEMHWMKVEDMDPVSDDIKKQLRSKKRAAVWIESHCFAISMRDEFVNLLNRELAQYKLGVDAYGTCGNLQCPHDSPGNCLNLIKDTYYFYLAFESSFSEDYVTEKLLHALQNDAIPIVYGGANYTRFMPDGIYLDALELGAVNLAKKMQELIKDPEKYSEYFKWKRYYSYHRTYESVETNTYCSICSILNNKQMVKNTTIYKDFRNWWNVPDKCTEEII